MTEPDPGDPPLPRYWFPAKRYGYGWGLPATWEGWVLLLAYVAAVIAGFLVSEDTGGVVALVGVVPLLAACWWRGEPARWRWGRR